MRLQDSRVKSRVIFSLSELRDSVLLQQSGYFPPHSVDQCVRADSPVSIAVFLKKRFDCAVAQGEIQHVIVNAGFYEMVQATSGRNMQRDFDVRLGRLKGENVIVSILGD